MASSGYQQLAQLIFTSPSFDKTHRVDLKNIVYKLSLDEIEGIEDINDKWKGQLDMEAMMVFLLGFYRDKKAEFEVDLETEEGLALLDVPDKNAGGYKTGAKEAKAHVATTADVAAVKIHLRPLQSLYDNLSNLFGIVLRRNAKLEQMSINYRREKQIDERA